MSDRIKPGMLIKDNDPRMPDRVLSVHCVNGSIAVCHTTWPHRVCKIKTARIHTDGKPRKSGFSLFTARPEA